MRTNMLKQTLLNIISKYSDFSDATKDRKIEDVNITPTTVNMAVHAPFYLSNPRSANLTFDNIQVVVVNNSIKINLNNSQNVYSTIILNSLDECKKFIKECL